MIKSMTGFGKVECALENKTISIVIRSVNSKQLDILFHLPLKYRDYEFDFRAEATKIAQRGKIDVTVTCTTNAGNASANINKDAVAAYFNQLQPIAEEMKIDINSTVILKSILSMPGVFEVEGKTENVEEKEIVFDCFRKAFKEFNNYREHEGAALISDIMKRVDNIENLLSEVAKFEGERLAQIKLRIENSFNEFIPSVQVDKNRFEQEMIYYLEKLDITEEKVRLKQHCDYFRQTAKEENSGRKLGFISQEMGREINTLGSKANDVNIQRLVVQMKDELEKIKEQILNIL
jgi:TIGR00255 family protein